MGFWSNLFSRMKSNDKGPRVTGHSLVDQYGPLMLDPQNSNVPPTDRKGNKISNLAQFNITGTSYDHLNSTPAKEIPKLHPCDKLVLAPNPENEHDPHAVRVLTVNGKQIGWIPAAYEGKDLIFRRLQEGFEICCLVKDFGQSKSGVPWCEIRIATYATPFDPSIEEKYPNSLLTTSLKLNGLL